ncbi:hypothetical protein A6X21_18890 [Planctopirus hydrillae]|uniref:Uncharacterized protein n=1 Tax=Planctopirus hydrillae TaxID=1841610 RepID=A0A1C3EJF1_9PLAN|nr:hypothetical protein A6X21_18890 [Planctopirus hydrillae]
MRHLKTISLALGMISLLISLLPLGFAALGFLGILADIGPGENRKMGIQLLTWGLPPFIGGIVLCALGLLAHVTNHRHTHKAPSTASNNRSTQDL